MRKSGVCSSTSTGDFDWTTTTVTLTISKVTPFSGIVGHEIPRHFFKNFSSEFDRMPHALLLHGPSGVGKFALASVFVKAFNCLQDSNPGCDCNHCRQINMGTFSDVLISSSMQEIKAGQMRQLIKEVVITPRISKYRFVIIDEFDRVNETSANIFLKTLEEPPDSLRFILITSRPEKLLPTIRSRCIPMDFKPSGTTEIARVLKDIFPDVDSTRIDTAASNGRFGKAAREVYADNVLVSSEDAKQSEPYVQLLSAFIDGLLETKPNDYAYYLKSSLATLLEAVEGRWKLKEMLPKGLDAFGLKKFIAGELKDFTPVNYLTEDDKPGKMREYDKARILVEDLTQMLYLQLRRSYTGETNGLKSKILHYMKTVREIGANLRGYRNIELTFEKLLIGPDVSSTLQL